MRCHAIQVDLVHESPDENRRVYEAAIAAAAPVGGDLVLLPEFSDTGYSQDLDAVADNGCLEWAASLAAAHDCFLQVGWIGRSGDRGSNHASIIGRDGSVLATYAKVFPCGPMGEGRTFDSGDELIIVDTGTLRICPMICYDLRFPELWRIAGQRGVDCFMIGANWPRSRIAHWRSLLVARAVEQQAWVVAANRIGSDPAIEYGGASMVVSPMGEVVAELGEESPGCAAATIDLEAQRAWRADFAVLGDLKPALLGDLPIREVSAPA